MADMRRIRVDWAGSPVVGNGFSTFYQELDAGGDPPATGGPTALVTFFTAIRNFFPAGITWTIPSAGDEIEDLSGDLVGVWSEPGSGGVVTSNGTANFAAGVGARAVWQTGGTYRGRRVKGSTFLCPLVASAYPSNATLDDTVVAALSAAASTLATSGKGFTVYSRKAPASATRPATDGTNSTITAGSVPDRVSWIRSRRV